MLNFNVDPYYDDFDPSKNFHRVLFKPGYSVQARELTQAQTILQDQISKFANHIFTQNSPVTGGQVTSNFSCYYIKLLNQYNNTNIVASDFLNKIITDDSGQILAKVIATAESTGTDVQAGDPPTLIVTYLSGTRFTDGMHVFPLDGTSVDATTIGSTGGETCTGKSSTVSISDGVFYVVNGYSQSNVQNQDGSYTKYSIGNFVSVQPQTIILDKYSNTPSYRVGLSINETVVDYIGDKSLLDPAVGASNYQAPGADRYTIKLTLSALPTDLGNDDQFIELVRIESGNIVKQVDSSVYSTIDDYFAKRTYETNGDYIVNDFRFTPSANTLDPDKYILSVGPGKAYVQGYRLENQSTLQLDSERARTTDNILNNSNFIDYGSYFYVDNVRGSNGSFFSPTTSSAVDFHTVRAENINSSNTNLYYSTVAATGYIRALSYDSAANTANTKTYVYKAYVFDTSNKVLTGTVSSATSSTLTFNNPDAKLSVVANAYIGVTLSIDSGPGAGDVRKITNHSGTTVTVDSPFSVTPTASSTFSLRFGAKDFESIVRANTTFAVLGSAAIANTGKVNQIQSGDAVFNNPGTPELLFPLGVSFANNVTDASYTTTQEFRNQVFGVYSTGSQRTVSLDNAATGTFDFLRGGATESADAIKQNFMVVVTDKGSNSGIEVGDIVNFTSAGRTVAVDANKNSVTFTALDLSPFTATVYVKMAVSDASDTNFILKTKTLVEANTAHVNYTGPDGIMNGTTYLDLNNGQAWVTTPGVASYGTKQSLYVSDVKRIVKIIDTGGLNPTDAMLTNPGYDVTSRYEFNNGQTDNYYGHAYITLKPGQKKPEGLLILFDWYEHSGGDGYFSPSSYTNSGFTDRPVYKSKNGTTYSLRDCLDFRPVVKNAQTSFTFSYKITPTISNNSGTFLPVDLSTFTCDYSYYLGRKDIVVIGKDKGLRIIKGKPDVNPSFPVTPEGSLVLANITLDPYTAYLPGESTTQNSNIYIQPVLHKRWSFRDISDLQSRVNNLEYYASLNLVEQNAANLQIPDANGLNRFKNGILVDDFTTFGVADTYNPDFSAALNTRLQALTPAFSIKNYSLQNQSVLNDRNLSQATLDSLSFVPIKDGLSTTFTIPYTETELVSQPLASRVTNVNPFAVQYSVGNIFLSPSVDNWIENTRNPDLLFVDPNLKVYQASSQLNLIDGDPTLAVGDWKTIPGTEKTSSTTTTSGRTQTTTTIVTGTQQNQYTYGYWSQTYNQIGQFITNVSLIPYIRQQYVYFRAEGLAFNTKLNAYFDEQRVIQNIRRANVIDLSSVSGTFNGGDTIGYISSSTFYKTGNVIGVTKLNNGLTRLYVVGDANQNTYTTNGTIVNGFFNTSGVYQSSTASGTVSATTHYSGKISTTAASTTTVALDTKASSTDIYTGKEFYIPFGSGRSSIPTGAKVLITAYNTSTKTITLDTAISYSANDIYSIGGLESNECGSVHGMLYIPGGEFRTGERVFRLDNKVEQVVGSEFVYSKGTETTYAEGTFASQGLATNSTSIEYAASQASAKNTLTTIKSVSNYIKSVTVTQVQLPPPPAGDPVAQTFIIDAQSYPSGAFLSSINLFFKKKPTTNIPVQLYIVPTLNGYPSGTSLDNSTVWLNADQVKISETPHYKDSTTATTFTFTAPVFINPDRLYAFVVRSASTDYELWTAAQNDFALLSTSKALPTDTNPTSPTKIVTTPYVGDLFESQNSLSWKSDLTKDLMFVMNRCKFSTTTSTTIPFVVPAGLPERKTLDVNFATKTSNTVFDALNISTTDFIPPGTTISYQYTSTLNSSGESDGPYSVLPGKYATPMSNDISLDDYKGSRVLNYASNTSFKLDAVLSTTNDAVAPLISDDGLSIFTTRYRINNMGLSNTDISIINGGVGYLANANGTISSPDISVSVPDTVGGEQAYVSANVVQGNIVSVYVTTAGSGYLKTPTITISATSNVSANVAVTGETSNKGGNALAKYITLPVSLADGNDSGDLRVYLSAYRPVGTDIHVYYKLVARNDTQNIDDSTWQLMTNVGGGSAKYSVNKNDIYEYEFAPGIGGVANNSLSYVSSVTGLKYTNFYQYAIKIVMSSSDSTFVPIIKDMRTIALPSGTGL